MPYIQIEAIPMSKDAKRNMIIEVTDVISKYMELPPETVYITIKENEQDNWGVGGVMLSEMNVSK